MKLRLECLGGFREVGRNGILLDNGKERILMDYGIHPDEQDVPLPANKVSGLFLGHAHLDHCGAIPTLFRKQRFPVYATAATLDQAYLLLNDSLKIMRLENKPRIFSDREVAMMQGNNKIVTYGQTVETKTTSTEILDAGHIPGSMCTVMDFGKKRVLYTSDFNMLNTRLLNGAKISQFKDIDVLIMESTYSARDHPPREQSEKALIENVTETIGNGGVAILPAFAVGRAAEVAMILHAAKPNYPIYMDGMAKTATEITLRYPELLRNPKALQAAADHVVPLNSDEERSKAIKEPCAIITTSGMLEGGPASFYIKRLYSKPECSLTLTGFQAPKTAGRYLLDTGRFVTEGFDLAVKMKVTQLDFSVSPETPVLVRDLDKTELCPIKDVASKFDMNTLECFAFDRDDLQGGWYKVSAMLEHNYDGNMYKIVTKTGKSVEITEGHSIFVLRDGEIIDVPGEQVKVGDYIVVPKHMAPEDLSKELSFSKYFKGAQYSTHAPESVLVNAAFSRLLGYYVAEGHCNTRIGISLNKMTEEDLAREVISEVNSVFPKLNVVEYNPSPSELQLRFGGTLTARIFEDLGGKGSYNKKVPEFLFRSSKDNIGHFIGAYLTGDGWFDKEKIRVKSVSEGLIGDLLYLLLQMGVVAKYDGIRVAKERKAPQGTIFKESVSHVLRIQGKKDLEIIRTYLRGKIRKDTEKYLQNDRRTFSAPPRGLPVRQLKMKDNVEGYNWRIEKILRSDTRNHMSPDLLRNVTIKAGILSKVIMGDVLFDVVKNVSSRPYKGKVYDLSVPGPQNFLGGFGGIFLHNSAHAGRTQLLEFVQKLRPEKVICVHGDYCERFATELRGRFAVDAVAPEQGETVEL